MGWEEKKTLAGLAYYYNTDNEEITWEKPEELQTSEEKELSKGDWTWVPHPTDLWQPALKLNTNGDGSTDCRTENGKMITIPKGGLLKNPNWTGEKEVAVPLWPLQRSTLVFQEDDLVMLDQLNEAMIIYNLRTRYAQNDLYTWVGAARSVLVSVNPYKMLPLYGEDQVKLYRFKPPNTKLAPHVFDIANDAYNSLLFEHKNQSILISGESGAGKTVATKHCLKFLAQTAGSERNVEERVIMANPLLEAYGNAQTIRNNNSSRFGKWIQVYFDPLQRAIVSAEIINYLLEKSRLVSQQKGERNYHIFYQLTKDSSAKQKYGLEGPDKYRYTNVSGTYDAKDIDDLEEYQTVLAALKELGFSEEEQEFLFSIPAAILKLGNCKFDEKKEKNNVTGSQLNSSSKSFVSSAAKLLGVPEPELTKVLSYRSIKVRGVKSVIPLDPEKAKNSCDSLAMGVYGKLFNWLVKRVNEALLGDKASGVDVSGGKYGFIGILDIFGFEIFDQNGFEQLCINFANEKLQQQFNKTTFKEEEELYQKQAIKFTHVEFIDNQVVCDLIEKPPSGLLPMLDDECLIPEGSDVKYMNKIEDKYKSHDKFQTDTHRKLDNSFNFEIVHYAGVVKYNGEGFKEKNTDSMFTDQETMLNNSKNQYIQLLFKKEDDSIRKTRSARGKKGSKSLSYQFRNQLNELMSSLYSTESRYIRCVKPNGHQVPDRFQAVLVNEQLRYSGVFEAVEIRRLGFPFRLTFNQFITKYSCINMESYESGSGIKRERVVQYKNDPKSDPRAVCEEILKRNRYNFEDIVFGKTMLLYKTNEHRLLTLLREFSLEKLIPRAQSVMRGNLAREMRRRCNDLNKVLQDAMDVGNDIDLIDKALAEIDPKLAHMLDLFPGVYPTKKQAAIRQRNALQKWKELEAEFERVNNIPDGGQAEFEEIDALVQAGRDIIDIPRTETQIKLFEEAVEQRNHLEVKLEAIDIEENYEKYSDLSTFPGIRDEQSYSRSVSFMKKAYIEVMYKFQKSRLPNSVTQLGDDKEFIKEVKNNYEKIKEYSGQKKTKSEKPDLAAAIMSFGKQSQELQDEVWVHLLKMVTENPNPEWLSACWDLVAMAVFCLKASKELEKYVICRLKDAPNKSAQKFISAFHAVKYSENYADMPNEGMPAQLLEQERNRFSLRHADAIQENKE